MTDRLQDIRGRLDAATPGPWVLTNGWGPGPDGLMRFARIATDDFMTSVVESGGADVVAAREDAEFIAHARTDVPWLIAEVERLRGVLDRLMARDQIVNQGAEA